MEDFVVLKEKNLEYVQLTYGGDLRLFNNYPIKDLNNIIDDKDVKYIIEVEEEQFYIVVTRHTYVELLQQKMLDIYENKNKEKEDEVDE